MTQGDLRTVAVDVLHYQVFELEWDFHCSQNFTMATCHHKHVGEKKQADLKKWREGGRDRGREGRWEGGMEGGMEGGIEGGREGGREGGGGGGGEGGGREGGMEGGIEGGREGGREGGGGGGGREEVGREGGMEGGTFFFFLFSTRWRSPSCSSRRPGATIENLCTNKNTERRQHK